MTKKLLALLVLGGSVALLAGCGTKEVEEVVVDETVVEEVVVEETPVVEEVVVDETAPVVEAPEVAE